MRKPKQQEINGLKIINDDEGLIDFEYLLLCETYIHEIEKKY